MAIGKISIETTHRAVPRRQLSFLYIVGDVVVDVIAIATVGTPMRVTNYCAVVEVRSNKLSVVVWSNCDDDRDEEQNLTHVPLTCMVTSSVTDIPNYSSSVAFIFIQIILSSVFIFWC